MTRFGGLVEVVPVAGAVLHGVALELDSAWRARCFQTVRVLGHAGVALAMLAFYAKENAPAGAATTIALSVTTSLALYDDELLMRAALLVAALSVFARRADLYASALVGWSAWLVATPGDNRIEAFAFCGHVTLLAASMPQRGSYGRLLAPVTVLALAPSDAHSILLYAALWSGVPLIATTCCDSKRDENDDNKKDEKDEEESATDAAEVADALWELDGGRVRTIALLSYAAAMLASEWASQSRCAGELHDDVSQTRELLALHVGGVVAVCLFLFPQVARESFAAMRLLLATVAFLDGGWSILNAIIEHADAPDSFGLIGWLCATRGATASLLALAIATASRASRFALSPDTLARSHSSASSPARRLVAGALTVAYVSETLCAARVELVAIPTPVMARNVFGRAVHQCFIVGGLSIEALAYDDRLLLRLARTLLLFEAIGTASGIAESARWMHLGLSTVLCVALPSTGRRFRGGSLTFSASRH